MKVRWIKVPLTDGTNRYDCERDGVIVGSVALTGRYGADDYPWEWSVVYRVPVVGRNGTGATDTLRSGKEALLYAIGAKA